jgi:hypothetical protein
LLTNKSYTKNKSAIELLCIFPDENICCAISLKAALYYLNKVSSSGLVGSKLILEVIYIVGTFV